MFNRFIFELYRKCLVRSYLNSPADPEAKNSPRNKELTLSNFQLFNKAFDVQAICLINRKT